MYLDIISHWAQNYQNDNRDTNSDPEKLVFRKNFKRKVYIFYHDLMPKERRFFDFIPTYVLFILNWVWFNLKNVFGLIFRESLQAIIIYIFLKPCYFSDSYISITRRREGPLRFGTLQEYIYGYVLWVFEQNDNRGSISVDGP